MTSSEQKMQEINELTYWQGNSLLITICFGEAKRKVCCQLAVPISLAATLTKEQTDRHAIQLNVHRTITTAEHFLYGWSVCLYVPLYP